MSEPTDLLLGLRASTADLLRDLTEQRWTDADVGRSTLLPDWTRGHLLTHLARNADGVSGTLSGALRGEVVPLYPGGREQRAAAIDDGCTRPVAEQLADLADATAKLDRVAAAVSEADAWDRLAGDDAPARDWLVRRWLEVEIHHVDLDTGYTPDRWPPLFVDIALPIGATDLESRADTAVHVVAERSASVDDHETAWQAGAGEHIEVRGPEWAVLAWLLGRASTAEHALTTVPPLAPWR